MLRRRLMKNDIPEGAVELGLPSGTLWAIGNITKDVNDNYSIASPTDYGAYFSWGDIEGHRVAGQNDSYSFNSFNYSNGVSGQGHNLTADFTGDATYDAARVKLGSPWRIPTYNEYNELQNSCTWNWKAAGNTDYDGIAGYEVVGPNGNKIFLPCTGCYYSSSFSEPGTNGYYWSSSFNDSSSAYYFRLSGSYRNTNLSIRRYGLAVRAVQ